LFDCNLAAFFHPYRVHLLKFFRQKKWCVSIAWFVTAGFLGVNLFPVLYHAYQHEVLCERFEQLLLDGIEQSLTTKFEFSLEQASQLNRPDDHEIEVNGVVYDIISEVYGTLVLITCVSDADEKLLEQKAEEMMKAHTRPGSHQVYPEGPVLFPPPEFSVSYQCLFPSLQAPSWFREEPVGPGQSSRPFIPPDFLRI
jgi:hypothetical protein